jgi:hypothetical protein
MEATDWARPKLITLGRDGRLRRGATMIILARPAGASHLRGGIVTTFESGKSLSKTCPVRETSIQDNGSRILLGLQRAPVFPLLMFFPFVN